MVERHFQYADQSYFTAVFNPDVKALLSL